MISGNQEAYADMCISLYIDLSISDPPPPSPATPPRLASIISVQFFKILDTHLLLLYTLPGVLVIRGGVSCLFEYPCYTVQEISVYIICEQGENVNTEENEILDDFFEEDISPPTKDDLEEALTPDEPEEEKPPAAKRSFFAPGKEKTQLNWLSDRPSQKDMEDAAPKMPGRPKGAKDKKEKTNKAIRVAIQIMKATGITEPAMAQMLGKDLRTLRKNFAHELEYGKDMLTVRVVNSLVKKALDGNVPAATLYLKSQAGWKEQDATALPDDGQLRISEVERTQRLMAIMLSDPGILQSVRAKRLAAAPTETVVDVEPVEEKDVFDV